MRTSQRTSNSIIGPAGEPRPTVCVSSAVQIVSDLEDQSDAGRYNCCLSVDIVLVRSSCRQSRTVYCVEAFVRHPVSTVCACLLCKCVSDYVSRRESDTVSAVCFVMVVVMSSWDLVHHVSCADCSLLLLFLFPLFISPSFHCRPAPWWSLHAGLLLKGQAFTPLFTVESKQQLSEMGTVNSQ